MPRWELNKKMSSRVPMGGDSWNNLILFSLDLQEEEDHVQLLNISYIKNCRFRFDLRLHLKICQRASNDICSFVSISTTIANNSRGELYFWSVIIVVAKYFVSTAYPSACISETTSPTISSTLSRSPNQYLKPNSTVDVIRYTAFTEIL